MPVSSQTLYITPVLTDDGWRFNSDGVYPDPEPGENLVAGYYFNDGDTKADDKNGFSWDSGTGTYNSPAGETEIGLQFTWAAQPDPTDDWSAEERFTFTEQDTVYIYTRFFIPANYFHRRVSVLTVAGDISAWQVGDALLGADSISTSSIYLIDGTTVYTLFSQNPSSNDAWSGSVTNVTRSQSRTSTRQPSESDNNKVMAIWCDGYSSLGQSPSVVWEMRSNGTGGSDLYYHWSTDGTGTGYAPGSNSPEVSFITDDDLGTWMELIFRVTMASTEIAADGIIETWLKREGETEFTRIHNQTDATIGPRAAASDAIWQAGYFWGYSNSGYKEETKIHVSEVELYDGLPAHLGA